VVVMGSDGPEMRSKKDGSATELRNSNAQHYKACTSSK